MVDTVTGRLHLLPAHSRHLKAAPRCLHTLASFKTVWQISEVLLLCRDSYFVPLISFMAGIFVAECVHRRYKCMEKVHWRQLIILAEIVLLFFVGFLPQEVNTFANALVSFVCAMQVQTFRKVRGHAYASTMCIGNMRSGTEALCAYFHTHDREVLKKALTYFGVIGIFAVGAGLGSVLTARFAEKGIWVSCLLLAVSFLMMFVREEEKK